MAADPSMTDQFNHDFSMPPSEARPRRRWVTALALIAALAAGFGGGYAFVSYRDAQTPDPIIKTVINTEDGASQAVDFSLFWQVWERLHERYVDADTLDAQKLVYGAISGMVGAAGDPYTQFLEPSDAKQFEEDVNGAFSGVGMELGERESGIVVIAPLRDTPAMRAGIRSGDFVIKVDGEDTSGWTVEQAVLRIRGKQGTVVRLTIAREGEAELLEFSIERAVIRVPAVEWRMLDGGVAYVQILTFNGNVEDEFNAAARALQEQGATRLVIDLRNNPGGLLDASVRIAEWMLPTGSTVVQEKFADGSMESLSANGSAQLVGLPTIVLINGGSASASEILAGALHDVSGVRLVGEKTFGKGSVQQLESFYNGSSLKVTIAKWLTPNGVSIADAGIAPTDAVAWDLDTAETEGWELGTPGKDPQLDRALELIRTP